MFRLHSVPIQPLAGRNVNHIGAECLALSLDSGILKFEFVTNDSLYNITHDLNTGLTDIFDVYRNREVRPNTYNDESYGNGDLKHCKLYY